jgi:branched-chain amino acid transport system substrate-binding protein
MKFFDFLRAFFLSIFFIFSASYWVAARAQDIRIGTVSDQSGMQSDISRDYLAGARTYFDQINSQGGINGRKINLVVKDDEGSAANTVKLTRELIDADRVDALFGYVGDDGIQAVSQDAVFKASRVMLYAPLSGANVGTSTDNVFFVRPTYQAEAKHILEHFSLLGNTTFVIVNSIDSFGLKMAEELSDQLRAKQLKPATKFSLSSRLDNVDLVAREVLKLKPQVVVVAADTISMAEFLKKFRALDKGTNVVGFSTVNHRTLMELAKPEFAASTMLTQVVPHPQANDSKVQFEHRAMMKKFRDEPPSHLTLEGFLAAKGLVRAMERAAQSAARSVTRTSIATALKGSKQFDLDGITLVFSPDNDRGSKFVDLAYLRKSGTLVQ